MARTRCFFYLVGPCVYFMLFAKLPCTWRRSSFRFGRRTRLLCGASFLQLSRSFAHCVPIGLFDRMMHIHCFLQLVLLHFYVSLVLRMVMRLVRARKPGSSSFYSRSLHLALRGVPDLSLSHHAPPRSAAVIDLSSTCGRDQHVQRVPAALRGVVQLLRQ